MSTAEAPVRERLLTIGTVCRRLKPEFPDVSISKIRYLEDQGLLTPKRTQGGYRLFAEDDVERLETILRMQRDEFLPLRVIREELAAGASKERRRKRSGGLGDREEPLDLDALCERAGIQPARAPFLAVSAHARARDVSTRASASRIAAASPGSLRRAGEGRRRASRKTASSAGLACPAVGATERSAVSATARAA